MQASSLLNVVVQDSSLLNIVVQGSSQLREVEQARGLHHKLASEDGTIQIWDASPATERTERRTELGSSSRQTILRIL